MSERSLAVVGTGLVSSVGLDAQSSCAAIRAKLTNPTETGFIVDNGEAIIAHQVRLERPWRGYAKLTRMACMAIGEALSGAPNLRSDDIPLLLCVAEPGRAGRMQGLEDRLFALIQEMLGRRFAHNSAVVAMGRPGGAWALAQARDLIARSEAEHVLVAAADSLVNWPALKSLYEADRLLGEDLSDGLMPGEAAAAILVTRTGRGAGLQFVGIGLGGEPSGIASGAPMRAEGLTAVIKSSLAEADLKLHDIAYRITDLSGEQFYFKEAALALNRVLRRRREDFELWHPAESIGDTGAAAGLASFVVGQQAALGGYAPGGSVLFHFGNEEGARAAVAAVAVTA